MESERKVCTKPETCLIPSFIADKDDEGSVVFLDIVIDQNWYSRVQLFAHSEKVGAKIFHASA